ncbi:unnamed protein product, partial [Amoebophrya sp. A25]
NLGLATTSGLYLSAAVVQSVATNEFASLPSVDAGIFFDSSQCERPYFVIVHTNKDDPFAAPYIKKYRLPGIVPDSKSSLMADDENDKWFQDTMEELIELEMKAAKKKEKRIRVFFTPSALERYNKIPEEMKRKKSKKDFQQLEARDQKIFEYYQRSTDSSHLFISQEVLNNINAELQKNGQGEASFQAGNINVVTRCPASAAVAFGASTPFAYSAEQYFTGNRMYCKSESTFSFWKRELFRQKSCNQWHQPEILPRGCGMSVHDELERIIDKHIPIIKIRGNGQNKGFSIRSWKWMNSRKVFE